MTRPSVKQKADASAQLEIFIRNMIPAQARDVFSISQAWGEIEIFEYISEKSSERSASGTEYSNDRASSRSPLQ